MGRKRNTEFGPVLTRVLRVVDVSDLASLAGRLEISPYTVRNWHTRGRVPYEWLERIAQKYASTMDYLIHGVTLRNGVYYDESGCVVPAPEVEAREEPRPYQFGQANLDDSALETALTAVLLAAERRARPLDARRLAKLVSMVYERTTELIQRGDGAADDVARREADKLVDLIAG